MRLVDRIRDWYSGRYVPPRNDPDSTLVVISPGHYEQPLMAKFLRTAGRFWLAHWQWIIGTILAIIGIIVTLML